ncbi:lipopolysaccharide assembly protein LapA domain-containing protein [Geodermatophilus sp. SYSU D00758]
MAGTASRAPSPEQPARTWLRPPVVLALVLGLAVLVFIAQNRDSVSVHLLWATLSAPQWLLLTLTALAGAAVGALLRRRNPR